MSPDGRGFALNSNKERRDREHSPDDEEHSDGVAPEDDRLGRWRVEASNPENVLQTWDRAEADTYVVAQSALISNHGDSNYEDDAA